MKSVSEVGGDARCQRPRERVVTQVEVRENGRVHAAQHVQ